MPGGRPPKYDKEFHPENYIELCKEGLLHVEICARWDISAETLNAWSKKHEEFSEVVRQGKRHSETAFIKMARGQIDGSLKGQFGPLQMIMRNKFGYDTLEKRGQEPQKVIIQYVNESETTQTSDDVSSEPE